MIKNDSNLMSAILEVQDNLVILLNTKGEIIEFNKTFEKTTGYSFSEVKNKNIWQVLIIKDEIEEIKKVFNDLKAKNFPNEHENYIKTKNGNLKLISWTNSVLLDENNKVKYIVATGKDISEKKWNEKILKKSQKIAKLGNWELNLRTNTLYWSDEIYHIFGLNPEEFEPTYNSFLNIVHPEDREKVDNVYNFSVKKNKDKYEIEHRIIRQDNGEIRYVKEKSEHIRNDQGEIVRSLGIVQDITERKKLQKNLKEKNILFDSILESIQDGISVLNTDLTIRYTNSTMKEWYKGQLPLKGKNCFKAYHDKDSTCQNCPTLKSFKTGEVESEVLPGFKNSEIDFVEVFSYPIWDENKENITGVVEFVRDITERVNRRKQLEMMNFTVDKSNLLIFRVNSEGIIEYVNETVLNKLGYKRKELIGENTKKIVNIKDNYIDREKLWNKIKNSRVITYEREFITKKGNKFPVEITSQYFKYKDKEYEFVFANDITEKKEQRAYFEKLFDNSTEAIVLLDNNHRVMKINKKFESLFGYKESDLKNKNLDDYILPENLINEGKGFTEKVKQGGEVEVESVRKAKDGKKVNVHLQGFPIKLENGYIGIYAIYKDITDRKEREKKIQYLLYKDQLTNLYNRRFFEEELKRLDTKRQLPISVIMADVNGLKIVNDSYGHKKGDELLKRTARILKDSVRDEDILTRQGGDEFAILLPQTEKDKAKKLIRRIKNETAKTNKETVPVSIALGVATKEKIEQNIENILKKADDNMYQNKLSESENSKNNIVRGLLNTLSNKSSETKPHIERMINLSKKFGKKLNLCDSKMNKLSLLANLHDIGKTTISEKILNKSGELTKEEWEIMKEHAETGYKIATASNEFVLVAEEILSHHEHWDGSGYPKGLEGAEIPYLARIISIVDAYNVMTHDRPYSKTMSNKKALEEIKDCAGSQFDPKLVKEFIELQTSD